MDKAEAAISGRDRKDPAVASGSGALGIGLLARSASLRYKNGNSSLSSVPG